MAILTQHAPGTFCWPELGTSDQDAAKKFYSGIFGWAPNDMPMGEDAGVYTIFRTDGKDCAALYTLNPDQKKMGVPAHWGAYVYVQNADDTANKAKAAGGTVMMEPFDVMGTLGRMAIIQDPTGAVFSVWQAKDHHGASILDEPGALCWTELMTTDVPKAKAFYTSVIGWKAEDMPGMSYTMFKRADGTKAGGLMAMPSEMKGVPPHWMSYFQVSDIQATVKKATDLGGTVAVPPTVIPNMCTFAVLMDAQGAAFSVMQPMR